MKSGFSSVLADLMRQADGDLDFRLDAQEEALRDTTCTNPLVGQWIDQNHTGYLMAIFDLDDGEFGKRFPFLSHVTRKQRQAMTAAVEEHLDYCHHCSLKRGFDLEFDSRIQRTCRDNRNTLLQLLDEADGDAVEGDHLPLLSASRSEYIKVALAKGALHESRMVMEPIGETVG
jgi:hypothetical protein